MSAVLEATNPIPAPAMRPAERDEGFFAHHGIWAPGVRLFRRLRFGAKAVIAGTFTVGPLVASNMLAGRVSQPILRLSQLVSDLPALKEMDLNPVMAFEDGVVVVDARISI